MKRLGLTLAGGAVALVIGAAIVADPIVRPRCVELGNVQTLSIPFGKLARGTVNFFCFRDRAGNKIRFLLARDMDGKVQSAFDACSQCYKFGKGFSVSHGELICRVCGNHYKLSEIRTGKASCVPVKLPVSENRDGMVQVKASDLRNGRSLF
ncbi:MAG TPA: Fe-S-containing protein [Candidatus Binataceae bacterium]|nr:Fe-S-containing protein [Candidatus Binataceae bacterium]